MRKFLHNLPAGWGIIPAFAIICAIAAWGQS
jgi:hypothetical protein